MAPGSGLVQPEVSGCDSTTCPFSYEAVIEDAPQVQSASPIERWFIEAPPEATQAAVTNSAPMTEASFLTRARDDGSRRKPPNSIRPH